MKVRLRDFAEFDYIFAMDRSNLYDLKRLQHRQPAGKAKVMLLGEYSGGNIEIEDPYYGGDEGFALAYELCLRFSKDFLKAVFPEVGAEDVRLGSSS